MPIRHFEGSGVFEKIWKHIMSFGRRPRTTDEKGLTYARTPSASRPEKKGRKLSIN